MTGAEHYREAERLITVGEQVAAEIRSTKGDEPRRDALGNGGVGGRCGAATTAVTRRATLAGGRR